jgi:hypothetical protein
VRVETRHVGRRERYGEDARHTAAERRRSECVWGTDKVVLQVAEPEEAATNNLVRDGKRDQERQTAAVTCRRVVGCGALITGRISHSPPHVR